MRRGLGGRRSLRVLALGLPVLALAGILPSGGEASAQDTHVLVVTGLGGDPEFRDRFYEWGEEMYDAALDAGVAPHRIRLLTEDPERDPERVQARSTREEVERAFQELAQEVAPQDQVLIVLVGHGSGSGPDSRVSLPGPSLTAAEYRRLVESLPAGTVAVVNAASGSGDFIPELSGPGRIVVTATRSSAQRNAPIFGGHFVSAFRDGAGDLDRDGRVSLLEAFEYARQETRRFYEERGLLAGEQALLEDGAEGMGHEAPMDDPAAGSVAARFFLGPGAPAEATVDEAEASPELQALYGRRDRLEGEMLDLSRREGEMAPEEYRSALEALVEELARVGQEIRRLEGGDG